jgi:predicted nucleic acid-binding protein
VEDSGPLGRLNSLRAAFLALERRHTHALRGLLIGGRVSRARAEGALLVKESLVLHRYPDAVTGPRAWDLRGNLNPYDASYVALAEQLQCPLVTTDAKIERQVRTVEVKLYR